MSHFSFISGLLLRSYRHATAAAQLRVKYLLHNEVPTAPSTSLLQTLSPGTCGTYNEPQQSRIGSICRRLTRPIPSHPNFSTPASRWIEFLITYLNSGGQSPSQCAADCQDRVGSVSRHARGPRSFLHLHSNSLRQRTEIASWLAGEDDEGGGPPVQGEVSSCALQVYYSVVYRSEMEPEQPSGVGPWVPGPGPRRLASESRRSNPSEHSPT